MHLIHLTHLTSQLSLPYLKLAQNILSKHTGNMPHCRLYLDDHLADWELWLLPLPSIMRRSKLIAQEKIKNQNSNHGFIMQITFTAS